MSRRYAIVDLETTGGMPKRDRITEIGIVIFDGNQILETYTSLINPCRSIPYEITRITGITDDMVADAPKFYEIARNIVEITEGCIFVAHNVRFDYGFLQHEFSELGYTYSRKLLDTVRLSRMSFPGLRSYSLGNLIKAFNLSVNARHRALEDALATTEILKLAIDKDNAVENIDTIVNKGIKSSRLPKEISLEVLHSLPEEAGVYYFHDKDGRIIYIGKSINIKKRVMQHFVKISSKAEKLVKRVADISYELTGNELVALLLESEEIKKYLPEINKAQRTRQYSFFSYYYYDEAGYLCVDYAKSNAKNRKGKNILSFHSNRPATLSDLSRACEILELCQAKLSINKDRTPCFYYTVEKCYGACTGLESPESYNVRAEGVLTLMNRVFDENFILILKGRSADEKALVLVEHGMYKGFGYLAAEDLEYGVEEMKEAIRYVPESPEANMIIKAYLEKNPNTEKVYL